MREVEKDSKKDAHGPVPESGEKAEAKAETKENEGLVSESGGKAEPDQIPEEERKILEHGQNKGVRTETGSGDGASTFGISAPIRKDGEQCSEYGVRKNKKCPLCDYTTARSYDLARHTSIVHLKRRPHRCCDCGCDFATLANLKKHLDTVHSGGEKPHRCLHCGHRSASTSNLKNHVRSVHRGEKRYRCPHCDYRCVESGTLRKHVSAVHRGEKPIRCPHCEYRTSYSGALKKHVSAKHSIDIRPDVVQS